MVGTTLGRLRDATATAHQRLEARLNILDKIADPAGRRRLVERFHALHAGAEAVMSPLLAAVPDLAYDGRRRSGDLARDVAALGGRAPPAVPIPAPASAAEALGRLYVLEGSTLGGKVIGRQVAARGQDMTGLSFLDPYGPETGERWRSFLAVLEREGAASEAACEDIVRGGVAGFAQAEQWLCEPAVAS